MRRIAIEIEGKNENEAVAIIQQAVRNAAKGSKDTCILCSFDAPVREEPQISIPSFIRSGRTERMGVVH